MGRINKCNTRLKVVVYMQPLIPFFQTVQFNFSMPDFMPMDKLVVHGFGLCVGIGVVYGSQLAFNRGKRIGLDDFTMKLIFVWMLFGTLVGGHIGYGLMYEPQRYLSNPSLFLDIRSGMSSFAGFISCTIGFLAILWYRRKQFLPYIDTIMYGFSFGWLFGRMGCTLNHEHPGTATTFWLGRYCRPVEGYTLQMPEWMTMPGISDLRFSHCIEDYTRVTSYADTVPVDYAGVVAVHDMGMYEMFYAGILLMTYLWLDKKPQRSGLYLLILIYTYAPLRFVMDFFRPDEGNARYSGLTPAQWGCVAFLVLGTAAIIYFRKHFSVPVPEQIPASSPGAVQRATAVKTKSQTASRKKQNKKKKR